MEEPESAWDDSEKSMRELVTNLNALAGFAQFGGESRKSRTPCWSQLDSNSRATS